MNLDEVLRPVNKNTTSVQLPIRTGIKIHSPQRVSEELAHRGLNPKDGLVRGCSEVNDAVVQARVLAHADVRAVLLVEVRLGAGGVIDL